MNQTPPPKIYTIAELTQKIRNELEQNFENIWVDGEVSNLRIPPSGHIYFTLKDKSSQLKVIFFKGRLRYLKFQLQDGMQVLVKGSITVYEKRGEYQLLADYAEPKGIGALQIAFEELKQRLAEEGLFDEAHKKPLPLLPRCIGLVTSPTGAAIRDILNVIERRFPNVRIVINPVRVQGEEAAQEIARAIAELNELPELEILIVGRGGGSLEDLWCFNEEVVARAIYNSRLPVISAVGHEIDYTIADFVADLRAPTPSAAAELVVESKEALIDKLRSLQIRLNQGIKYLLDTHKRRQQLLLQSPFFVDPGRRVREYQQRLDELMVSQRKEMGYLLQQAGHQLKYLEQRLKSYQPAQQIKNSRQRLMQSTDKLSLVHNHFIEGCQVRLRAVMGRLDALSPLAILKRGYSICRRWPGLEVLTNAEEVKPAEQVSVKLYQGDLLCTVLEIERE
jgi:exodeoxyribonuclease VII large subunit